MCAHLGVCTCVQCVSRCVACPHECEPVHVFVSTVHMCICPGDSGRRVPGGGGHQPGLELGRCGLGDQDPWSGPSYLSWYPQLPSIPLLTWVRNYLQQLTSQSLSSLGLCTRCLLFPKCTLFPLSWNMPAHPSLGRTCLVISRPPSSSHKASSLIWIIKL